jgi:hypothetical protein
VESQGSVPSKLRVSDEVIPGFAHIGEQRLDLLVHDSISNRPDRLANLKNKRAKRGSYSIAQSSHRNTHNVVPTPDGESHAMSDEV